ncbi:MAG: L,D-transpeptidase [Hyphomicrobiaceae bacterium]
MVRRTIGIAFVFVLTGASAAVAAGDQPASAVVTASVQMDLPALSLPSAAPAIAVAPAAKPAPPPVTLVLNADLTHQRLIVTVNGKVQHTWPISSGRYGYATPTGKFKPQWLARSWFSRQYDDAPMPYSVFFNGGIAFHGTQSVSMLGRAASHGCVRLSVSHAKTLYGLVQKHGLAGTRITVSGKAKSAPPQVARRSRDRYADDDRFYGRRGETRYLRAFNDPSPFGRWASPYAYRYR